MSYDNPFSRGLRFLSPEPSYGNALQQALLGSGTGQVGAEQQVLAQVNLTPAEARTWCVTIVGLRYADGTLVANGNAPDAQVDQGFAKLAIQWGVGGAIEDALVDYPWAGCTFQFHASTIRVAAITAAIRQNNVQSPFGAFITPGSSRDNAQLPATFTTPTQTATGGGAAGVFPIPRRARGYIPYFTDIVSGDTAAFRINELWGGNNSVVKQDTLNLAPSGVNYLGSNPDGRDGFIRLHPRATVLEAAQTNGVLARQVGIIYMLDLG